jgi:hypothetical protein
MQVAYESLCNSLCPYDHTYIRSNKRSHERYRNLVFGYFSDSRAGFRNEYPTRSQETRANVEEVKAHDGIRTRDLFLTKEVLYRLSYMGIDPHGLGAAAHLNPLRNPLHPLMSIVHMSICPHVDPATPLSPPWLAA